MVISLRWKFLCTFITLTVMGCCEGSGSCPANYDKVMVKYDSNSMSLTGGVSASIDRHLGRNAEDTHAKTANVFEAFKGHRAPFLKMEGKDSIVLKHKTDKNIIPIRICTKAQHVRNCFIEFFSVTKKDADYNCKINFKNGDMSKMSPSERCTADTELHKVNDPVKTIKIQYRTWHSGNVFYVREVHAILCVEK